MYFVVLCTNEVKGQKVNDQSQLCLQAYCLRQRLLSRRRIWVPSVLTSHPFLGVFPSKDSILEF